MGKFKQWIVSHKLVSIIMASVLTVGVALSIALPLTLVHRHAFSAEWSHDATYHWHACIGGNCNEREGNAEHDFENKNSGAQYWRECSDCGYQVRTTVSGATTEEFKNNFKNALNFKDVNGNMYSNWEAVCKDREDTVTRTVKMTENASYVERSAGSEIFAKYIVWANVNDHGIILQKQNDSKEWIETRKYASSFNEEALVRLPKSAITSLSECVNYDFEYKPESESYYHETFVNSSGPSSICYCYDIKFENDKMVSFVAATKLVVTSSTPSTSSILAASLWTISYGNATVELPSDSEVITPTEVEYTSTSENSFVTVENITLSANETKWFRIYITDAMYELNKGSSKPSLEGTFTASDSTAELTIEGEAENRTSVTNYGGTNGSLSFDDLSKGAFFIKITADKDCTGSLSVQFG